jgi:chromosome segregation ATPase
MALFEKLEGPRPTNNRNSMSGLRTPTRYSVHAASTMSRTTEKNWTLKASYVEIYNEQLRDLLVPEHVPQSERGQVTIREDTKGHILLTGLHQVEINSVEDLMAALNFGSMIRQTDSTAINAKSSRSHAVFSLNLVQRKSKSQHTQGAEKRFSVPLEAMAGTDSWTTFDSKLHFVDLAGSERLKNTGAQGERAKEGISINAGLASLGKVISQLSSRQAGAHVSYRDSKLTRLLQDSLGGNAITYMIACVTPAEFHLSETLNTVQYAQRARAIQSKPQIQQMSDDGDKQGLIDRLKAEVAFLREQIRSSERTGGGRTNTSSNERPERQNEREIELQNQLLDTQENYTTLSQRHAKLISEMTKARDGEIADNKAFEDTLGDSATERLKRSNSFAEAVEQVVLEYEKTIQSLEQSLSSTRSSLSTTETTLLERETKCAYVETVNQQLQARLQKLMDRESSTENYLHDLETKLDGHTSGEEKNTAIVSELRKEIARLRENEASCEDYISTLEERLAESDQDSELMQRELERLEHVVERQRSLGKLDNLLYELDHIPQDGKHVDIEAPPTVNGKSINGKSINGKRDPWAHSRNQSLASRRSHKDVILENREEEFDSENQDRALLSPSARSEIDGPIDDGESIEEDQPAKKSLQKPAGADYPPQSPAQSKFVADKLENVTQELFDLRVEHESTISEYDMLAAKYEEALRTLSELQDAVDEARHPTARDSMLSLPSPTLAKLGSFLSDARVNELKQDAGQSLPSRSLSSELSLAGEHISIYSTIDAEAMTKTTELQDRTVAEEVENLRNLAMEKEDAQAQLTEKYVLLQEQHMETLDIVEELKTEVSKAKANAQEAANSPRSASPVIRRKSSQNVMIIDRAHRSFASLRNIATENFEDQPDVMQNFELNLNSAMHELHSRSERVQELEADIGAVKKEMETKMTIISGLTRERSSLRHSASPIDMSVVSTMQDQLLKSENQVKIMQETHLMREKELQTELNSLRASIEERTQSSKSVGDQNDQSISQEKKISDLQSELAKWEDRHQTTLESMNSSEKNLLATIAEFEAGVIAAPVASAPVEVPNKEQSRSIDKADYEQYQAEHQDLVNSLQKEIEEHKSAVIANATRVAELEESHALTRAQLDETTKSRDLTATESQGQKSLVSNLEQQIRHHEQMVKTHQDGLSLLKENHAKQLEEIASTAAADHEAQIMQLTSKHEASTQSLQAELTNARNSLTNVATQVATALGVEVSIEKLQERISSLLADQTALSVERKRGNEFENHLVELSTINDTVMKELEGVKAELSGLLAQTGEGAKLKMEHSTVSEQLAALKKEMNALETKNKKNSRLVEELEDQLATNFDEQQMATNRLSTLQTERNVQLDEANANYARVQAELAATKEEYAALQVSLFVMDVSIRC